LVLANQHLDVGAIGRVGHEAQIGAIEVDRLLGVLLHAIDLRDVEQQARRRRELIGALERLDGGLELADLVVRHALLVELARRTGDGVDPVASAGSFAIAGGSFAVAGGSFAGAAPVVAGALTVAGAVPVAGASARVSFHTSAATATTASPTASATSVRGGRA